MFKLAAGVWVTILAIGMVLSLAFNIAVVGFASVSAAVGGIYDAVTGTKSVVSALHEKVSTKEAQLTKLTGERDRLTREVSVKDGRIAQLKDEVADLRRPKTVMYRGKQRLLTEAVADTNGRIARRTARAASRNASSVVAEAIPYVGIAAMVSVTAYDLIDSCETIKDLHELDVALDPTKEFGPGETEVCGLQVPTAEEVWQSVKDNYHEAWDAAGE